MKRLIDKLRHYHSLTGEEYANLLSCQDTGTLLYLQQQAGKSLWHISGMGYLSADLSR